MLVVCAWQVLELLPDSSLLSEFAPYFAQVLPNSLHRVSNGQIVRNLSNVHRLHVQVERAQLQRRRVQITEDTRCQKSGKPIGDFAFAVFPDGKLVHARFVNKT